MSQTHWSQRLHDVLNANEKPSYELLEESVAELLQERKAMTDERRNIAEVKRTSDMGLSLSFMSARACSAFERYLSAPAAQACLPGAGSSH